MKYVIFVYFMVSAFSSLAQFTYCDSLCPQFTFNDFLIEKIWIYDLNNKNLGKKDSLGLPHGIWTEIQHSGFHDLMWLVITVGEYNHGKKEGTWRTYRKEVYDPIRFKGKIKKTKKSDSLDDEKMFEIYFNYVTLNKGDTLYLHEVCFYDNGELNGPFILFDLEYKIEYYAAFSHGKIDGKYISFINENEFCIECELGIVTKVYFNNNTNLKIGDACDFFRVLK